jgi:hypothetical protein
MKRECKFCGEPMLESARECKQCGWKRSQDGPPSQDPGDKKARIGVAIGLLVAYGVMFNLISRTEASARPAQATRNYSPADAPVSTSEPDVGQAIAVGTLRSAAVTSPAAIAKPGAPISIKVADAKSAGIRAHDALDYTFDLPETGQNCHLVGQIHGLDGFDRDLEVFLLTGDDYLFWRANPMGVPHSAWPTSRGSESTLNYLLTGAGTYHLVVSNMMAAAPKTVQVKAQVKCTT